MIILIKERSIYNKQFLLEWIRAEKLSFIFFCFHIISVLFMFWFSGFSWTNSWNFDDEYKIRCESPQAQHNQA